MIRRPPRSPLFPYTTLSDLGSLNFRRSPCIRPNCPACRSGEKRSEEHTSELQSRLHLVCRLLLEKKKKKLCSLSSNPILNTDITTVPQSYIHQKTLPSTQAV